MDEKEVTGRFVEVFNIIIRILADMKKGFLTQNEPEIKRSIERFRTGMKTGTQFVDKIIAEKDKDEPEKKFATMLLTFQVVILGVENLMHKMETKVRSKILFSQKAINEIEVLYSSMEGLFVDFKDYVITKNPHLKDKIIEGREFINKTINEYDVVHQQRLITGVCMPEASYLYLDMTDSFKRIAKGIRDLTEKI